jgi:spermidine synthase
MFDFCKEIFPVVDYTMVSVPTYPSGQIGFIKKPKRRRKKSESCTIGSDR